MNPRLSPDEVRSRVRHLPGLPTVVLELDRALRSEEGSSDGIVRLIGRDAGLTAMALKLANSSFYGASGRVQSLRDAVQILGLRTLSTAVMTAAVMARLDPAGCPGYDGEAAWRHALGTALCAQRLADARGVDACAAYTTGLLLDVGMLALATTFPEPYAAVLAWGARHDVPPLDAERELLGVDHAEVGGMLAEHWRFPPAITHAIHRHHAVPDGQGDPLLDVVHVADNIAHALDLSRLAGAMVPPLSLAAWRRVQPPEEELRAVFEHVEDRLAHLDPSLFR